MSFTDQMKNMQIISNCCNLNISNVHFVIHRCRAVVMPLLHLIENLERKKRAREKMGEMLQK